MSWRRRAAVPSAGTAARCGTKPNQRAEISLVSPPHPSLIGPTGRCQRTASVSGRGPLGLASVSAPARGRGGRAPMSAPGKSTTPHQGGPSSGPHQGPIRALIRAGLPGRGTQRVPCGHRALTRRRPRPLRQPSPSRSSHSPSPAPAPTPPPFPSVAAWPACAATHARVRVASPVRGGASPVSAAAARLPASLAAQCASSRRRSAERVTGPGAGHGPRSGGTGARGGGRGGAALSCGASLRPSSPDTRAHRPRALLSLASSPL